MDDKTYIQIKEMLDQKVEEIKQYAAIARTSADKCEKFTALCEEIATDLAKRGDGV